MLSQRLVIDTDTASDDAVALVMALRTPNVVVEAITVVAGNVPLDQATQNALYTRELCRSDAPVYRGRAAPLARALETAQFVHGEDGMGDIGLPLSGRAADGEDAVSVLVATFMKAPGDIDLVTLGPLSNVAEALAMEPAMAQAVKHCFVMGGKCSGPGNITPVAEYNLWADPEAAQRVARSGMPLTIIGWDMSVRHAVFGPSDAAVLRALGPLGEFCVDIQATVDYYARNESGLAGFDLPDPLAMAVAIEPGIAGFALHLLDVVVGDGNNRGSDEIDWLDASGKEKNARVTTWVDRPSFIEMLYKACRDGPSRA